VLHLRIQGGIIYRINKQINADGYRFVNLSRCQNWYKLHSATGGEKEIKRLESTAENLYAVLQEHRRIIENNSDFSVLAAAVARLPCLSSYTLVMEDAFIYGQSKPAGTEWIGDLLPSRTFLERHLCATIQALHIAEIMGVSVKSFNIQGMYEIAHHRDRYSRCTCYKMFSETFSSLSALRLYLNSVDPTPNESPPLFSWPEYTLATGLRHLSLGAGRTLKTLDLRISPDVTRVDLKFFHEMFELSEERLFPVLEEVKLEGFIISASQLQNLISKQWSNISTLTLDNIYLFFDGLLRRMNADPKREPAVRQRLCGYLASMSKTVKLKNAILVDLDLSDRVELYSTAPFGIDGRLPQLEKLLMGGVKENEVVDTFRLLECRWKHIQI
jgi:hypothetical protein